MREKARKIKEFLEVLEASLIKVKIEGNESDKWYVAIEGLKQLLRVVAWCTSLELHRLNYLLQPIQKTELTADELLDIVFKYQAQYYVELCESVEIVNMD